MKGDDREADGHKAVTVEPELPPLPSVQDIGDIEVRESRQEGTGDNHGWRVMDETFEVTQEDTRMGHMEAHSGNWKKQPKSRNRGKVGRSRAQFPRCLVPFRPPSHRVSSFMGSTMEN